MEGEPASTGEKEAFEDKVKSVEVIQAHFGLTMAKIYL